MLGTGRPFAVQLLNARKLKPLGNYETLSKLQAEINCDLDVKVCQLCRVSQKSAQILNVGQEGLFFVF